MKIHPHLAVVGCIRVHGEWEDAALLYKGLDVAEAKAAFTKTLREDADEPDAGVYVSYVLVSESPIVIEEHCV